MIKHSEQIEHWTDLFIGYFSGTLNGEERAEFETLMSDSRFRALRERLETAGYAARRMEGYEPYDERRAFERFRRAVGIGPRRTNPLRRWGYAVAGLAASIAIVAGVLLSQHRPDEARERTLRLAETRYAAPDQVTLTLADGRSISLEESAETQIEGVGRISYDDEGIKYDTSTETAPEVATCNELSVPEWCKCRITLDDGTKVWLNSGSSLRYPVKFTGKERRVELSGEALFDVTHNPASVFVVETGKTTMTVRGTKFNVRDFAGESLAHTTLIEGCVEVENQTGKVTLHPGMQSQTHGPSDSLSVREVDTSIYTAWTEDKIAFYNAGLEEVLAEIGRYYRVQTHIFVDPAAYALTGKIPRDYSLAQVIELLESITDLEFQMPDENTLTVNRKP